jgi:hypothetical protein
MQITFGQMAFGHVVCFVGTFSFYYFCRQAS